MLHKGAYEAKYGKWHKILTLKQMLQRLPIVFSKRKAGKEKKNLLDEICQ